MLWNEVSFMNKKNNDQSTTRKNCRSPDMIWSGRYVIKLQKLKPKFGTNFSHNHKNKCIWRQNKNHFQTHYAQKQTLSFLILHHHSNTSLKQNPILISLHTPPPPHRHCPPSDKAIPRKMRLILHWPQEETKIQDKRRTQKRRTQKRRSRKENNACEGKPLVQGGKIDFFPHSLRTIYFFLFLYSGRSDFMVRQLQIWKGKSPPG